MNNPNKEGQVERNIEENSRFVLDKDKEKWIKELKNAKGTWVLKLILFLLKIHLCCMLWFIFLHHTFNDYYCIAAI